jgi:hypothetical protein
MRWLFRLGKDYYVLLATLQDETGRFLFFYGLFLHDGHNVPEVLHVGFFIIDVDFLVFAIVLLKQRFLFNSRTDVTAGLLSPEYLLLESEAQKGRSVLELDSLEVALMQVQFDGLFDAGTLVLFGRPLQCLELVTMREGDNGVIIIPRLEIK